MAMKDRALSFLRAAASGQARKVFPTYMTPGFRHHNVYFSGDGETLMRAMDEDAAQHPDKVLQVQHVLEDGNLVAVHSRVQHGPGDRGAAVIHIFRFEGDRIAELWDIGQEVPKHSPNEHGMF